MNLAKVCFLLFIIVSLSSVMATEDDSEISLLAPKVFIDCGRCDFDYIRTEINFINFVIDRKEADIHIIITDRETASGGMEKTLTFIGQRRFHSKNDTISYMTNQGDTWDEERTKMVKYFKMGLMSYVARTSVAGVTDIAIEYTGPDTYIIQEDEWDNWVFRVNLGGFARGEDAKRHRNLDGRIRADRITEDWKIRLSQYLDYHEESYKIDGKTVTGISRRTDFDGMVVKSLTDHWSTGLMSEVASSSFSNTELSFSLRAAVEYNIFPYSESTRREFRIYYGLGPAYTKYIEPTVYNKLEEALVTELLSMRLEVKQPWGQIDLSVEGSHYFHDITKNRLRLNSSFHLHLVRGLSLLIRGELSRIHDQLSLPKGDTTDEDIILEMRELQTQYSYRISMGVEYTFGSTNNNIVNPRF
ncbi:MAG TPA: hypothetical protein DHW42_06760 [Candidatus Marinimicrobia bacterium]|nr:hypothetical protein [Candidatus Neomarinimicrobiota bacterium]